MRIWFTHKHQIFYELSIFMVYLTFYCYELSRIPGINTDVFIYLIILYLEVFK